MVQRNFWLIPNKILNLSDISFSLGFFVLLKVNFLGSNLLDKRIQGQEINVLQMVICSIVFLKLLWCFTRVNTFQNAQSPKIFKRKLKLTDGFSPADIFSCLAPLTCLDFSHFIFIKSIVDDIITNLFPKI